LPIIIKLMFPMRCVTGLTIQQIITTWALSWDFTDPASTLLDSE